MVRVKETNTSNFLKKGLASVAWIGRIEVAGLKDASFSSG
jgi:hypothetical protein